jgi:hypothetical protein
MLRILHLFYEILLSSEQLQNMILLYLDIILRTRKTLLSTILTFLSQGVIILAEIVFGILQNYTLTESQQFHIEQLPRQKWRKASLYLFKT